MTTPKRRTGKGQKRVQLKAAGRRATTRKNVAGVEPVELSLADELRTRKNVLGRQRAAALRVLAVHEKRLMARKDVVGVDVGLKMKNDEYVRPARYVIRVHVAAKLCPTSLSDRRKLPPQLDGIEVDVLERRYVQGAAEEPELRRFRNPMSGGVAISGDQGATFGTLGMRVFLAGRPMYLTNAHVVPDVGAKVWQPPATGPNTPVGESRVIGRATDDQQRDDRVDCALIQPSGSRKFQGLVLGLAANVQYRVGSLQRRDENQTEVFKVGAKTGFKPMLLGIVDSVSASVNVEDMSFKGQIVVRGGEPGVFADRGDSGAILLRKIEDENLFEVVGLVHTTTADNRIAVAAHFKKVVQVLGITLQSDQ